MMKRAIELIRVSTESQAGEDRASIPSQRAINRRTAQAYGLEIVRSIEMSDVSGTAVLQAPEMLGLLELIKDSEIHGVIAREFSRLMRPEDFSDYYILQVFSDTKTILYLPEGPIDFSSKMGRMYGVMQAAYAGNQRIEFLENAWNSREIKRRRGELAQSKICLAFGVDYPWKFTADAERVREAFRLFLSGETSYMELSRKVGIEAFNLRNILRNPIYTGWRVIDKRRDMTPAGKYTTKNGRQGDRRKIKRTPDEVIRVKVLDSLISESDFNQVQRIIELKKSHHWRTREGYESRFTYRGLLRCSICEGLIYTKFRRADYYICKARHITHTCVAGYMRRETLERQLDSLFAEKLTRPTYLRKIERSMKESRPEVTRDLLTAQIESLTGKRQRILDTYFEGVIDSSDRDRRLSEIDREKGIVSELLNRQRPTGIDSNALAQVFSTFLRFKKLKPEQKRRLLTALAPEILVADYQVKGLYFSLEKSPRAADS
jgi:DNA invertase Pin-like site-specific DNA recombinase